MVPRFLCFEDVGALARVGLASAIAEGFVAVPSLRSCGARGTRDGRVTGPRRTEGLPPIAALGLAGQGTPRDADPRPSLPEQIRVRHRKLDRLRADGVDPYPVGLPPRTHDPGRRHAAADGAPGHGRRPRHAVRDHGGVVFAVLRDWSGDLQLVLTRDALGPTSWTASPPASTSATTSAPPARWHHDRGEISVRVTAWPLTGKCLRPLPDKRRGLADPEAKVRRRHLDLVASPAARGTCCGPAPPPCRRCARA